MRPGSSDFFPYVGDATSYALYANKTSVRPGESIRFFVNGPVGGVYRLDVFRLGWYGGVGARRFTCLPSCLASESAVQQPPAPAPDVDTGEVAAGWSATDTLRVGAGWPSGYYAARVWSRQPAGETSTAQVEFVVRQSPRAPRSDILVVSSTNTGEAYNNWGGASLYEFNSVGGIRASKVSFDRPLIGRDALGYEYPVVKFLERHDWDVSYTTDDAVDGDPSSLLSHRVVIDVGHGEYWTAQERRAFDTARNVGVNLMFMGSNVGYWQVRYEQHRRTLVAYKNGVDPDHSVDGETVRFRDLGKPECQLLGVQFDGGAQNAGSVPLDYVVDAGAGPWAVGTGLSEGEIIHHVAGYEFDSVAPGCKVPRPTVLFHAVGANAQAVTYVASSGARVFASGSLQFSWGLEGGPSTAADPRLRAFMTNYIESLLRRDPRRRSALWMRHARPSHD